MFTGKFRLVASGVSSNNDLAGSHAIQVGVGHGAIQDYQMGTPQVMAPLGTTSPVTATLALVFETSAFTVGVPVTFTLLATADVANEVSVSAHSAQLSVEELPN
jgi:hypothetical protein